MIKRLICLFKDHEVGWRALEPEMIEAMKELTPADCCAKWPIFHICVRCGAPVVTRYIYLDGKGFKGEPNDGQ